MVRTDSGQKTVYHVMSRTALDGLPFKDAEKDELVWGGRQSKNIEFRGSDETLMALL